MKEKSLSNEINSSSVLPNSTVYVPLGINRLFWLAAKGIAVADADFNAVENVRYALSKYSGCQVKHVGKRDMVDMVVSCLTEYYQHKGLGNNDLHELLKSLGTDYAKLVNEQWNQDTASDRIITSCMARLAVAPVRLNDMTLLVDLGDYDVDYDDVIERIRKYDTAA